MSRRKAITFLGNVPKTPENPFGYRETTYEYKGKQCRTPFVAKAVVEFLEPDELFVVVTPEARDNHLKDLEGQLPNSIQPQPIDIKAPRSDEDIWKMFQAITAEDVISPNDTIIFDVTFSFRSIPILAFLANTYLQLVRKTSLEALTYAEFVPGQAVTPLRNLTTFTKLLNWTTATDMFLKTGRAGDLVSLIRENSANTPLSEFATRLETLALELRTARPAKTMEAAAALPDAIQGAKAKLSPEKQPIGLLLDQIEEQYAQFGLASPMERRHGLKNLAIQLDMINWYLEKKLPIQAMTLAREWLVSLVAFYQDMNMFGEYKERSKVERLINGERSFPNVHPELQHVLPAIQRIWKRVEANAPDNQAAADLRNDIAHCGMRPVPRTAEQIQEEVTHICAGLRQLLPGDAEI
jgi:hypothetical protein